MKSHLIGVIISDVVLKNKENMKNRNKGTTKAKPVIQYDLNNNKIAEYESMHFAGFKTGINHKRISEVANGTRKSIKGYIFKFKGG